MTIYAAIGTILACICTGVNLVILFRMANPTPRTPNVSPYFYRMQGFEDCLGLMLQTGRITADEFNTMMYNKPTFDERTN